MKLDKKKLTFFIFGSRATFNILFRFNKDNQEKFMIVTSDVSTSAGLDRFRKCIKKITIL